MQELFQLLKNTLVKDVAKPTELVTFNFEDKLHDVLQVGYGRMILQFYFSYWFDDEI